MTLDRMASRAQAHIEAGELEEAIHIYRRMLEKHPEDAGTRHVLGLVYAANGDLSQACVQIEKAIALAPDHAPYFRSLGDVLYDNERFEAALEAYEKAIALEPEDCDTRLNLGNTRQRLGFGQEALEQYHRILAADPGHYKAMSNIGKLYFDQGDIDTSIEWYGKSISSAPDYAEARFNRSVALLLKGDYDKGWKEYEWRFQRAEARQVYPHALNGKRWDGSPFHGECLLVHCEQGLGDVLQFCRYLPMVKALGGTVVFECHPPLVALIRRMPSVDEVVPFDAGVPPSVRYSYHIPLLSLPGLFNTRRETIPRRIPYLEADADKVHQWEHRSDDRSFRVGLVWSGSKVDPSRACNLSDLLPIWDIPGIHFFSLQKGKSELDLQALPADLKITPLGPRLHDFDDTAAAMAGLDLIISVDTAVAHLAGAMGKAGMGAPAVRTGLALAAGTNRQPLVSYRQTFPPALPGRLDPCGQNPGRSP